MSIHSPEWRKPDAKGLRFAVITARFNAEITSKLLEGARQALRETGAEWDEYWVPGAFELPLAAHRVFAGSSRAEGVIALGAVVRGDTPHFDYVAGECARGLMRVSLDQGKPVSFGVLTTDNMEQALARSGGEHGNKGYDAAMTAIELAQFEVGPSA